MFGASLWMMVSSNALNSKFKETHHCCPDSTKVEGNVPLYRLRTRLRDEKKPNAALEFATS